MKNNCLFFILLLLFSIFFYSCKTFQPKKPEEKYLETKIERNLSTINIPVSISIADLQKQVNKQIQGLIYEDNSLTNNNNDNFLIKVWKKENISITSNSGVFNISIPLKIWAKAGVEFKQLGIKLSEFEETECELNVNFFTKIGISPDWKLKTQTYPNGFKWIVRPNIKIGAFKIPIDAFLDGIINDQQKNIAQLIDQQIPQNINLKGPVADAWTQVQAPIKISEEFNTWLKITPVEIVMTPVRGDGKKIQTSIGMKGYTETFTGNKPETPDNIPLPQLKAMDEIPSEFYIGLSGEITHEEASKLIGKQVVGQTYTFKDGKYKIKVTSVDLFGSGEKLVIKAGMEGSLKGFVYLSGKPYYDTLSSSIVIRDLDYDLETKNKLIKTAEWLAHGRFAKRMEEAFRIPLKEQIDQTKILVQEKIQNYPIAKGINLRGNLYEIVPKNVYITPKTIVATVVAKGNVGIEISDF